ncbi:MAG: hypothetical protein OXI87_19730 [Albidovulum sp.]|nr:hypothetical protein [Albidovulum sp.]MDE0531043.1 hypothetical protein [Albidovulum sp.]
MCVPWDQNVALPVSEIRPYRCLRPLRWPEVLVGVGNAQALWPGSERRHSIWCLPRMPASRVVTGSSDESVPLLCRSLSLVVRFADRPPVELSCIAERESRD